MRHYNKSNRHQDVDDKCLCVLSRRLCLSHLTAKGWLDGTLPLVVDHPHPKRAPSNWRHHGFCFTCRTCDIITPGDVGGNVPADPRRVVEEGWGYPARCSDCNTQLKRWRRSTDWADGISKSRSHQPRGRKRLFFVTFTERDEPVLRRTADPPMRRWEGVDEIASARTLDLVERCRRLFRTAAWKRHFDGHLWGAECTIRASSETLCEYRAFPAGGAAEAPAGAPENGEDITRRVFVNRLVWKVHPHLHCIAVGARWELEELDTLAAAYGLRSNIKMVDGRKSVRRATRYLTKYTVKEQPIVRAHGTAGVVRKGVAQIREARRLERLRDRESE